MGASAFESETDIEEGHTIEEMLEKLLAQLQSVWVYCNLKGNSSNDIGEQ